MVRTGQEEGEGVPTVIPFSKKRTLYQKILLSPSAGFYLHISGQHFVTQLPTQKDNYRRKLAFPASLVKGDKREGNHQRL
jgi:hypothetical protein